MVFYFFMGFHYKTHSFDLYYVKKKKFNKKNINIYNYYYIITKLVTISITISISITTATSITTIIAIRIATITTIRIIIITSFMIYIINAHFIFNPTFEA